MCFIIFKLSITQNLLSYDKINLTLKSFNFKKQRDSNKIFYNNVSCRSLQTESQSSLNEIKNKYCNLNKQKSKHQPIKQDYEIKDDRINLGHTNLKLKKNWQLNLNKYYLGERNNTVIFDYKFLNFYLTKAIFIFIFILQNKGSVLIINTNPELSKLVYFLKKKLQTIIELNKFKFKLNIFFIDSGSVKGTLTNWGKIFNIIKTFINFHADYNSFQSKNNIHLNNYKKMKKNYKGFMPFFSSLSKTKHLNITTLNSKSKPDLIVFMTTKNATSIIKEAKKLNIPVIAFIDSNDPILNICYPIPVNVFFYPVIWFFFCLVTKILNYKLNKPK